MRLLIILCLLCLPTLSQAACKGTDLRQSLSETDRAWIDNKVSEIPFAKGNHWIATRGNRRIHIVGTMHYNDPRMQPITQRLAPVVEDAEVLLMESSLADKAAFEAELPRRTDLIMINEGPSLIDRMSEKEWADLAALANRRGLPSWIAAKMRPWLLATTLSVPPCVKIDPKRLEGLDMRLGKIALAAGVPMQSLEDTMSVIETMNADPLEKQIREMTATMALMGGSEDDHFTLREGYFEERIAEVLALSELRALQKAELPRKEIQAIWNHAIEALLDERNRSWVPVIEATTGDHLVIAVGAAHLPGENGVLNLLQEQGYQLQRAQF